MANIKVQDVIAVIFKIMEQHPVSTLVIFLIILMEYYNGFGFIRLLCNYLPLKERNHVDLHGYTRRRALNVVDNFIDVKINNLRHRNDQSVNICFITGRGRHSRGGIPVIKPAVIERLKQRQLSCIFNSRNEGVVNTVVYPHSKPGFLNIYCAIIVCLLFFPLVINFHHFINCINDFGNHLIQYFK